MYSFHDACPPIQPDYSRRDPCFPSDSVGIYSLPEPFFPHHALQRQEGYPDHSPRTSDMAMDANASIITRYASSSKKPHTRPGTLATTTATTKAARTIPRSRHCGSPTPSESDLPTGDKYAPHKTTAQGFSVNNKVKKAKYATSIDDRGYLTVYEFQHNDQTIMWDYNSGFVHLTGIWKALGNSKADIVRLVENHPELEGVIKRIRGGFLKIQGTWVPYELCRRLALRTCYTIRHALISVFGPDFPDECLKPSVKGYGTLTLDDTGLDKRRKKRKLPVQVNDDCLTPPTDASQSQREKRPRQAHVNARTTEYSDAHSISSYSPDRELDPSMQQYMDKTSPPTMPRILHIPHTGYYPSKIELLDLLQASRSLQKLSSGGQEDWTAEGGRFNIAGGSTTFVWDGSESLEVLEPETYTTMDRSMGWHSPPRLSRKYSSATQESSLGDYPITPPQQGFAYPDLPQHIKAVPDFEVGEPRITSYHYPAQMQQEPYYAPPAMRDDTW